MRFVVDALASRMGATRCVVWMPGEQGLHVVGAIGVAAGPDLSPDDLIGPSLPHGGPLARRSRPCRWWRWPPSSATARWPRRSRTSTTPPRAVIGEPLGRGSPGGDLRSGRRPRHRQGDRAREPRVAGGAGRPPRGRGTQPGGHHYPAALAGQDSRRRRSRPTASRSVLAGALPGFQSEYDVAAAERSYSLQVDPLPEGGAVVRHVDISFRKHLQRQLAHRATHDTLTGLPNRMVMADRLGQALIRQHDPQLRRAALLRRGPVQTDQRHTGPCGGRSGPRGDRTTPTELRTAVRRGRPVRR